MASRPPKPSWPKSGDLPIIMVTSLTERQERLQAVKAGASDFIKTYRCHARSPAHGAPGTQAGPGRSQAPPAGARKDRAPAHHGATHIAAGSNAAAAADQGRAPGIHLLPARGHGVQEQRNLRPHQAHEPLFRAFGTQGRALGNRGGAHSPRQPAASARSAFRTTSCANPASWILASGASCRPTPPSGATSCPRSIPTTFRASAGADIPIEGRICAVADVFDALLSERPYKPKYGSEKALEIMRSQRGTHFDPQLLDLFLNDSGEFLVIVGQ